MGPEFGLWKNAEETGGDAEGNGGVEKVNSERDYNTLVLLAEVGDFAKGYYKSG